MIFSCLLSPGIWSCAERGDPVRETLDSIVEAAEDRDAAAVIAHLAADFRASDGSGRADAEAQLRRYLAAYESLQVRISDLSIERAPQAARATFRADMSGTARKIAGLEGLLPESSSWRFEVRLVPEGDRWEVAWLSYEPAGER